MEQTPKNVARKNFLDANNDVDRQKALEEHETISYNEVVNASNAEELSTLYREAMVHSPSRALALEKLAKEKGWDIQK